MCGFGKKTRNGFDLEGKVIRLRRQWEYSHKESEAISKEWKFSHLEPFPDNSHFFVFRYVSFSLTSSIFFSHKRCNSRSANRSRNRRFWRRKRNADKQGHPSGGKDWKRVTYDLYVEWRTIRGLWWNLIPGSANPDDRMCCSCLTGILVTFMDFLLD